MRALFLVVFFLLPAFLAPAAARADVVTLVNGDRVSGKILSATSRVVRLQTPFGVLSLPRERIERIERAQGAVEVVTAPPTPEPTPVPTPHPPKPARLQLAIDGDTFWQAWDPKDAPVDPGLRLELRLDDAVLVSYTDETLDPQDLPKAVVNSFVFSPEVLKVRVGEGVVAEPPIVVSGEIGLALRIPGALAGVHQLKLAYQVNEGTAANPRWGDVVRTQSEVVVVSGGTLAMRLDQSRGQMEYGKAKLLDGRSRMLKTETFTATLHREHSPATASAGSRE